MYRSTHILYTLLLSEDADAYSLIFCFKGQQTFMYFFNYMNSSARYVPQLAYLTFDCSLIPVISALYSSAFNYLHIECNTSLRYTFSHLFLLIGNHFVHVQTISIFFVLLIYHHALRKYFRIHSSLPTFLLTCILTYTNTCTYKHMYRNINIHTHTYIRIYTSIHTCTYIHTHKHTYIQTYIQVHTHILTYIYLHTNPSRTRQFVTVTSETLLPAASVPCPFNIPTVN